MAKQKTETTTIKIRKKTKTRLDNLKEYRRETYDEILEKIFEILNLYKINPERARSRLLNLDMKNKKIYKKTEIKNQKDSQEKISNLKDKEY